MLHLWFLYQKVNNNNQCLVFYQPQVQILQATVFTLYWCADLLQNVSAHEAHIAVGHTPIDWGNYCRKECQEANEKGKQKLEGSTVMGYP